MRVVVKGLLALAALSVATSCRLDTSGLNGRDAGLTGIQVPMTGAAGSGATGGTGSIYVGPDASAAAGQGGMDDPSGAAGTSAGAAGTDAPAGEAGTSGPGAAGDGGGAGTTGTNAGEAGAGEAGAGEAGTAAAGTSGGAAGTSAQGGAGGTTTKPPVSPIGCADGTREAFLDATKYPTIAACAGAWQIPGFVSPETFEPKCQRRSGNEPGSSANGQGCSVADLCAEGWHVCESVAEFKTKAADCNDVLVVIGGSPNFFATRQRGNGLGGDLVCDAKNLAGTNNFYGCGNIGSQAAKGCAPFTRMMRDADCKNNAPWTCVNGPIDYDILELADVTKPGPLRGGVLCCR